MKEFLKKYKKLLWLLLILILLTPAVYIVAERYNFGEAWGEWDSEMVKEMTGVQPKGMKDLEMLSEKAPLLDYSIPGIHGPWGYFISGIIGTAILVGIFLITANIKRRNKN